MKKMVTMIIAFSFIAYGCDTTNNKNVTCTYDDSGLSYQLDYNADEIVENITLVFKTQSEDKLSEDDIEDAKNAYESLYGEIEGLDIDVSVKKSKNVTIKLTVDLEDYDVDNDELGLFNNYELDDKNNINVKALTKQMNKNNMKCEDVK